MTRTFKQGAAMMEGSAHINANAAPRWDEIPFPVECSRCGHDLNGCEFPQCPACKLKFKWDDVVPLEHLKCADCEYLLRGLKETRCPECGKEFTWKSAIEHFRASTKPFFEYHWRRQPIKSLLFSCRLALRPTKLWSTISIHDPPSRGGLVAFSISLAMAFLLTLAVIVFASTAVIKTTHVVLHLPPGQFWTSYEVGRPYAWVVMGQWGGGIYSFTPWAFGYEELAYMGAAIFLWVSGGFGALLVLQQSMRKCRVRFGHIWRAYAYALIPIGVLLLTYWSMAALIDLIQVVGADLGLAGSWHVWLVFLACCVGLVRGIGYAYRDYIHMPHAWGVAIMSQIVAIVFTVTVMFVGMVGY